MKITGLPYVYNNSYRQRSAKHEESKKRNGKEAEKDEKNQKKKQDIQQDEGTNGNKLDLKF